MYLCCYLSCSEVVSIEPGSGPNGSASVGPGGAGLGALQRWHAWPPVQCHANIGLVIVVVSELHQMQMVLPAATKIHDAGSQHVFQSLDCPFRLAVSLKMICSTK